jgi:SAM-dependent methyltransferase
MEVPSAPGSDALELLSVSLLNEERPTVTDLKALADALAIGLGWHYLLDLVWILRRLGPVPSTVLDAGAGTGILQWYLADRGWHVLSVDRMSRRKLPPKFRARYRLSGLRADDLAAARRRPRTPTRPIIRRVRRALRALGVVLHRDGRRLVAPGPTEGLTAGLSTGDVVIYNEDLRSLTEIEDGSIDEVVSVSALEHNTPEDLPLAIAELMRVLKPGGRLIATTSASGGADWFHEPAQGWCYSEATLRRTFDLPASVVSNYDRYDELMATLRANGELRDNLAGLYFKSGDNGMPWGRWDPRYMAVGVCKVKPLS